MSDDPLADKIHRGQRAQALLDDLFFHDLCSDIERGIITDWMNTEDDDAAGRERHFVELRVFRKIRNKLEAVAGNGRVAQIDLERLIRDQDT